MASFKQNLILCHIKRIALLVVRLISLHAQIRKGMKDALFLREHKLGSSHLVKLEW